MSKVIWVLMMAVLLLVAAQVIVPKVAGQEIGQALTRLTGPGSHDTVSVGAVPFFELFQGRFQSVEVHATHVDAKGLTLADLDVAWQNGAVSVPALMNRHALSVKHTGALTTTVRVTAPALARFLDVSDRLQHTTVTINPTSVRIQGTVNVGDLGGTLDATGRLGVGDGGREILFYPTSVNGFNVPVATTLVIFDVTSLHLPVPLVLTGVSLEPTGIVVTARAR